MADSVPLNEEFYASEKPSTGGPDERKGEDIEAETEAEQAEGSSATFRTRRCLRWARGNCRLGDKCTFLHSGKAGTHYPCRNFLAGYCARGRLCDFKHEVPVMSPFFNPMAQLGLLGLATVNPNVWRQLPTAGMGMQGRSKPRPPCRHFEKGFCNLGVMCNFAHNAAAPARARLPENAKSIPCRHFEKGHCNLGDKCGFLHAERKPDESKEAKE